MPRKVMGASGIVIITVTSRKTSPTVTANPLMQRGSATVLGMLGSVHGCVRLYLARRPRSVAVKVIHAWRSTLKNSRIQAQRIAVQGPEGLQRCRTRYDADYM